MSTRITKTWFDGETVHVKEIDPRDVYKTEPPKMTHTLPWDYFRCAPVTVDAKCENCKRWREHPDQTHGPRTAYLQVADSKSEACSHIPISLLKEAQ